MEFSIKQSSPENQRSACVVLGVYEGGQLAPSAHGFDEAANHQLSDLIARGDMTGKSGSILMVHTLSGVAAERALLVGLGKQNEFNAKQFIDMLRPVFATLGKSVCKDAALYLTDLPVKDQDESWKITQIVLAAAESAYRSDGMKSKPAEKPALRKILLGTAKKPGAPGNNAPATHRSTPPTRINRPRCTVCSQRKDADRLNQWISTISQAKSRRYSAATTAAAGKAPRIP